MIWSRKKRRGAGSPVVLFQDPASGMALGARIARRKDFRPRWLVSPCRGALMTASEAVILMGILAGKAAVLQGGKA